MGRTVRVAAGVGGLGAAPRAVRADLEAHNFLCLTGLAAWDGLSHCAAGLGADDYVSELSDFFVHRGGLLLDPSKISKPCLSPKDGGIGVLGRRGQLVILSTPQSGSG